MTCGHQCGFPYAGGPTDHQTRSLADRLVEAARFTFPVHEYRQSGRDSPGGLNLGDHL